MKTDTGEILNIRVKVLAALIIAWATLIAYWQTSGNDFVSFDDQEYIFNNVFVNEGFTVKGIVWAFDYRQKKSNFYWQPLTWLSHMADCHIFGIDPGRHHFVGLMLHVANSLLLFLVLLKMTGATWRSAVVALLFALHPINVDSVAWASQRKNLLSAFFMLPTIFLYVRYANKRTLARYLAAIFVFTLGLMAKPSIVTLPCALLLFDFWPLNRLGILGPDKPAMPWKKAGFLILEKLPFFVVSVISVIISSSSVRLLSTVSFPLGLRIQNAIVSYVLYIKKLLWPFDLAVFYPFPHTIPGWQLVGSILILSGITVLAVWTARKKPYLATGWFFFLGMLVPMLGLISAGLWPRLGDRFAYIPFIGLFIILSWGLADVFSKTGKQATIAAAVILPFLLIPLTWVQTGYWKNGRILYERTLEVTSGNFVMHSNLGTEFYIQGKMKKALDHYKKSLELEPRYNVARINLGLYFMGLGENEKAITQFRKAVVNDPKDARGHIGLGKALFKIKKLSDAAVHFEQALALNPELSFVYLYLGDIRVEQSRFGEAAGHYVSALRYDPKLENAHYNLGKIFEMMGKYNQAHSRYAETVRINPKHSKAHVNLGAILAAQGKDQLAAAHYKQALQFDPYNETAILNHANMLLRSKQPRLAIRYFEKLLKLNPNHQKARDSLRKALDSLQ